MNCNGEGGKRIDTTAMLQDVLSHRFSCRRFLNRPVPRETIDAILAQAGRAPSWCNAQPWHAHIVSGGALDRLRLRMTAAAASGSGQPDIPFPTAYTGKHADRRRESGHALYRSVEIDRDDHVARHRLAMENFRLFGAPHLAIISIAKESGTYGAVDCGAFGLAFMLSAHSLGVATIAQGSVARYADIIRNAVTLTADRDVLFGISFGYAVAEDPINQFRTSRAPLHEIASFFGDC